MSAASLRSRWWPVAVNYRGKRVPVVGGVLLTGVVALVVAVSVLGSWLVRGSIGPEERSIVWILAGILVVFAAGLYDDFRPNRTRGIVHQLALAIRRTISSGIVKLLVIVGAAAFVAWMLGARGWRLVLAIPVVAGCANLWNLLDVRPGRALKAFLPAAAGVGIAAGGLFAALVAWPAAAAAAALLAVDLREWAMLGDGGSNVLGFIVGVGLLISVPVPGLAAALAVILVLHALAETVTLSRVIEAVPPLRWVDRVGRRPVPPSGRLEKSPDLGFRQD